MVPTIFPPSAVNRGESVHVRPPEPDRRPRHTAPAALTAQESFRVPKKRGRKPKLHLQYDQDDGGGSAEPDTKRARLEEPAPQGLHKAPRRLHHHGETSDHGLMQLTRRFQEETTITPKPGSGQRHAGLSYGCAFGPDVRKSHPGGHRTSCASGLSIPQPRKLKPPAEHGGHQVEQPALGSTQSTRPASSWTPCFTNVDSVTVTDVTMNLLTVTIRESSTDKGFFREKR